ncbi:MAG: hypothetical protein PF442_11640, partial [Desulfobulbaceae bacterium]|nr:hypothetical protein [Desulfobulbaceae bacterium]
MREAVLERAVAVAFEPGADIKSQRGETRLMTKSLKIILFTISGFTGILILVGLLLLLFVNTNANKLRLEAMASETLGMEVSVDGRMYIRFLPDLSVTL